MSKPETSSNAGADAGDVADVGGVLTFPRRSTPGQHIPATLTILVGRHRELAAAVALVRRPDVRLLTLTGPGGVGKTRLASQAGQMLMPDFPGGVVFVGLAGIGHRLLVIPAIARALGVTPGDERSLFARLTRLIGDRRVLLILDNFEHVIGASTIIAELIAACPNLKIIVTSRMPLHIVGEQEFAVPPLNVPPLLPLPSFDDLCRNPAVNLFVGRATAVKPDFVLTRANAPVIAAICVRLDGLPLAIELAAAWIKILTPSALLARLNDRLTILTGGAADLPERHRTMGNAISWSYDLLPRAERRAFRRLSIFSAGFSLEAAGQIVLTDFGAPDETDDILDLVASLVDKSLITQTESARGEPRFRMLEVIREFGLARLREEDAGDEVRRRFVAWSTGIAQATDGALIGERQREWLAMLDDEIDNLRRALSMAASDDATLHVDAVRMVTGLWRYWLTRGHLSEGLSGFRQALALPAPIPPALHAEALNNQGNLCMEIGALDDARLLYQQSLALYEHLGDDDGAANEMNNIGLIALIQGRCAEAHAILSASLMIRQDWLALPATLSNLGDVAMCEGNLGTAERYHLQALEIRREMSNNRGIASSCHALGTIAFQRGDLEAAKRWLREGSRLAVELGDTTLRATIDTSVGRVAIEEGDVPRAIELFSDALGIWRIMGSRRSLTTSFDGIAIALARIGEDEAAGRMVGVATALRAELRIAVPARLRADNDALTAVLKARLGETAWARLIEESTHLLPDQGVELALSLTRRAAAGLATAAVPAPSVPAVSGDHLARYRLTPRELDVLALLVQGQSNKEIAELLHISPRTAMTHVGNILAKLGVSKRAQVAHIVLRDGSAPAGSDLGSN